MNPSKNHQRRVHFSDDCLTFATIIPNRTPSPSHSDSGSDESDPPTPPNVQYIPTPYPFATAALSTSPPSSQGSSPSPSQFPIPMPSTQVTIGTPTPTSSPPHSYQLPQIPIAKQQPQQMNVHFLLAYSPYASSPLNYNLLNPPPPELLDEPATNPPLPQMLIACPFLPGNWQIRVTPGLVPTGLNGTEGLFSPETTVYSSLHGSPDEMASRGYVTVLDVLYALYISLRTILRQAEYQSLIASPLYSKETVNAAFWARLAQIEDPVKREEQRCRGVKRIDFLGGRTRFLGLAGTLKEDVWELGLGQVEPENW